jgi:deoxycytidine triphosphate deaminase
MVSAKEILIDSLDPRYQFSVDYQVTEDAIDLRLAPIALQFKKEVREVDYLKDDLPSLFEMIEIPTSGYRLLPRKPVFTQTLEAVTIPDTLVGYVVTRSTFARLGIMVNCMAPKFATGISWAFPLQLVNCNSFPVTIYPYAMIAQLMLSTMYGEPIGYKGQFQNCYTPIPPVISKRERSTLNAVSAESAQRTFHILSKEIELNKKEIQDRIQDAAVEKEAQKSAEPVTTKSLRALKISLGVISGIGFGILGNLLSGDTMSYWKAVSSVLIGILSIFALLASMFINEQTLKSLRFNPENQDKYPPQNL